MNSREFFNLFNLTESDYTKSFIWDNTVRTDIGFALVRTYPPNKRFIPAKNQSGSDDTVMLLKVFLTTVDREDSNKVSVGVTVSKISLFTLDKRDHFHDGYDFADPTCPTKESLEISEKSLQPINLEEMNKFVFYITTKEFFDKKTQKIVEARDIVEFLYKQHIDTYTSLRGSLLRFKMNSNTFVVKVIEKIGNGLVKVIPLLTGRKIENKAHNLLLSPFNFVVDPTKIKDVLEVKTVNYEDMLKRINPFTFLIITAVVLLLYILYYFCIDTLGIISFIKANGDDQVFSVTLIAFIVLFFNYVLPNILLFTLNILIKTVGKLYSKRFEL